MIRIKKILVLVCTYLCMVTCDDNTPDYISRPCGTSIDKQCVIDYLSENGKCSPVGDDDDDGKPENIYSGTPVTYEPAVGATTVKTKFKASQFDGFIEEFYVDKNSSSLVMTVNFKSIINSSPETLFIFGQKGKEPKVVKDTLETVCNDTVITAVVSLSPPAITMDSLKFAKFSAYILDPNLIRFDFGSNLKNSDDPVITDTLDKLEEKKIEVTREVFLTASSIFFLEYLQTNLCNFGVPIDLQYSYDSNAIKNIVDNDIDDESSFDKPCDGSDDMRSCVAKYFSDQGQCSKVDSPKPEPIVREFLNTPAPFLNVTAMPTNANLTGLNDGSIEEFYINKNTNNLVMSISFESIMMVSEIVPLIIYQRAKQPKILVDSNMDIYPAVILTAVIPLQDGLVTKALDKAYVYPDFAGPDPKFKMGDQYDKEDDAQVSKVLSDLHDNPKTVVQELFITEAYSLFLAYLQNNICDFDMMISDIPEPFRY